METKEELQEIIKDLKSKLDETSKKLKNFGILDRWRPQGGDTYYYIDSNVELNSGYCYQDDSDNTFLDTKIKNFNCFKTEEEVKKRIQKYLIESKIESIANRLNNGREIDWTNNDQNKYYLFLDSKERLFLDFDALVKRQGIIYCLDDSFLDVVKREINMTELLEYMKG